MAPSLGKPVVIENVSGASGNIACDKVAKSAPDGYTLVMCGNGSLVVAPSLYDKLPYDPVKDFVPISRIFVANNILVVHPDVPAKNLAELVALAKAKPGELTYAHTGAGTSQHLAGELFKSMAKVDIRPIAYRGSTALLPDLLAGRVAMGFTNIVNAAPLVKDGKLRAFAVSSSKRSALVPELPTLAESGFPGYEAVPWFGLMAPAGTPQAIIEKLHAEAVKALAFPDARAALVNQGLDVIGGTPAEFAAVIRSETPYWAKVIKEAGIKAE
jgi:tripartite-type tricarboxylate transporter receptor subunit TctC